MTWLLIVTTHVYLGATVSFAEFGNEKTCNSVADWLNQKSSVSAVCYYKGK